MKKKIANNNNSEKEKKISRFKLNSVSECVCVCGFGVTKYIGFVHTFRLWNTIYIKININININTSIGFISFGFDLFAME